MSKIVLYGTDISPPVRACLLTLNALELPYQYKIVDLFKVEHHSEEFVKHNPQKTVPVLDDDGIWIWDSHAICAYLVGKYGKTDKLYPKDLVKRAIVDQRMYFEASILFMSLRNISCPLFLQNKTVVPKEKVDNVYEGYNLAETFLGDNDYLTGNELTIADFCCGAILSSLRGIITMDAEKFPKIHAWLDRLAQLPYYDEMNGKGAQKYIDLMTSSITEIHYE